MVKVIGAPSEEEIKKRQRRSKLFDITDKYLNENKNWRYVFSTDDSFNLRDVRYSYYSRDPYGYENYTMKVHMLRNEITVHFESYIPNAIKLAEAYESSGENEFTVIKLEVIVEDHGGSDE